MADSISKKTPSVAIIGGGPAGLTASYLLSKEGLPVTVFESDPEYVGGISRTAKYKGFHFDIGGHRFFSKSQEVEDLWDEILPEPMLVRPRSSRIFYRRQFYSYPLKPFEALRKLGIFESLLCGFSYLKARMFPKKNPKNFEEWVSDRFGSRLYNIFFKTYTEKVWGIPCTALSADWAAQRIKGLSLFKAVFGALMPKRRNRSEVVKTLIQTFRYPRLGPGMMWEACAKKITDMGNTVKMGTRVVECRRAPGDTAWTITSVDGEGTRHTLTADHVISSTPIRTLIGMLAPPPSPEVAKAAASLSYRDFLTVVLICTGEPSFTDNWIYIHEPQMKVGRIQNFRAWSPEMVPESNKQCYGLEYFCNEGDELWSLSDAELVALGTTEMEGLGLVPKGTVVDGCVVRQPKAYPVYDDDYVRNVDTIRAELESKYPGMHPVGRNGMHKYNNQDHSMMTAMLTVRNIVANRELYDIWAVNEDAEYHEAGSTDAHKSGSGASLA